GFDVSDGHGAGAVFAEGVVHRLVVATRLVVRGQDRIAGAGAEPTNRAWGLAPVLKSVLAVGDAQPRCSAHAVVGLAVCVGVTMNRKPRTILEDACAPAVPG